MKILHLVGRSLVQRTPARIAAYWNRYFPHITATAMTLRPKPRPEHRLRYWQELTCPDGFVCFQTGGKAVLRELASEADVIHCHDDIYPPNLEQPHYKIDLRGKVLVYQAHIGSIPERFFHHARRFRWDHRVKHAAIPNGYGRLFDVDGQENGRRWGRLSDVLDISHPSFCPDPGLRRPQKKGRMRVVYTYSNQREGEKINAKRPRAHQRIVQRVRGIDFEMCYGESFEYSMSLKKSAHVVLEEVFSPFLHLSALEGALVGAMVLTKFDSYTKREVSRYLGAPEREWPFYYVTEKTLGKELERLRHEPEEVADWGRRGQEWMAKYHDPKRTLGKFLEFYGQ